MAKGKPPAGVHAASLNVEREAAPRAARSLIIVISALIFSLLAWASQTELQELARADGEIAPTGELRRVDHFDGGVIRELYVSAGETVVAGQSLAKLEQPGLAADTREVSQRLTEVNADISRLTELLRDAEEVAERALNTGASERPAAPGRADIYADAQHSLFLARQSILAERVNHRRAAIDAAQGLQENATNRAVLSDRALARFQRLFERGVVSESQFLEQSEETETVHSGLLTANVEMARAQNEFAEAEAAYREAALAYREQHLERLHLLQQEQRLLRVQADDLAARTARLELRAPEAGVIQSVSVSTVGEVVSPGGTVFELLPTSETLVAVIKINPKDIGHIHEGAMVRVKPSTFDARRFGHVSGVIERISPTTVIADREEPFFKTVIRLDDDHIGSGIYRRQLRAGMIVSAEVQTASRTVLSYLLKPINRSLERSLTER